MKNRIKQILNKYNSIFVFLMGGILLGPVIIYAANLVAASNVAFDNSNSKLTSVNVQSALEALATRSKQGNATAAQVFTGKKFMSGGSQLTGSMAYSNASNTATLTGSGNNLIFSVPTAKCYGSDAKLIANTASYESVLGNATTDKVLSGKTFTSKNGVKLTGTATKLPYKIAFGSVTGTNKATSTVTVSSLSKVYAVYAFGTNGAKHNTIIIDPYQKLQTEFYGVRRYYYSSDHYDGFANDAKSSIVTTTATYGTYRLYVRLATTANNKIYFDMPTTSGMPTTYYYFAVGE